MIQAIRSIATNILAVMAGAIAYVTVWVIMLLACLYIKLRGRDF